ncbi:MAG TPA: YcxB family protein [Bacteroidia bacterium]|nr:YcxB family protein [Bacteroidia bacterium]
MTLTYSLSADDYLTHQLYTASRTERLRKRRQRSKILYPAIFFCLALYLLWERGLAVAWPMFALSAGWFFLYPLWESHHYLKYYRRFVEENFKTSFGKSVVVTFDPDYILTQTELGEAKLSYGAIEGFGEIETLLLIKMTGGQSLVLPKNKIEESEAVVAELKNIASRLNVPYNIELNWKWNEF